VGKTLLSNIFIKFAVRVYRFAYLALLQAEVSACVLELVNVQNVCWLSFSA
jgi:hypothetical protein